MHRLLAAGQVADVVDQAFVVAEGVGVRVAVLILVVGALVDDGDRQALVEEGHFPKPRGQRVVGVVGGLEDVRAGVEGDRGAGLLARLQPLQRPVRLAELKLCVHR